MKPVFHILSIAVCGGAAFLSYQTNTKFKDQRQQTEDTEAKNRNVSKAADLKADELKEEEKVLAAAQGERETLNASLENLTAKEKQTQRQLAELDAKLEEQQKTFADVDAAMARARETLKSLNLGDDVDFDTLPVKVQEITADRDAKKKELAELEAAVEGMKKVVGGNREEISRLGDREADRNKRFRNNAMQSVVTAVNNDWGFVVIGAGSSTGFTPQTRLLVKRDGRLVAELKPSSIEPSQTIAEIDPDTVAPGARIQPGDQVILASPATN